MGNYSFKTTGLPEPVNGVVEGHNFQQSTKNTEIYAGYPSIIFKNCRLMNCIVPIGSTFINCLTGTKSYCSHLHPDWLARGYINECVQTCSHLDTTDSVTIDGVVVDTNYVYSDKGGV